MVTSLTLSSLAFIGSLGLPELIMIFLVLVFLAVPILLIYFLVRHFTAKGPSYPTPSPIPSTQARLQELDHLKSQNLISESEYEAKRKQILGGL